MKELILDPLLLLPIFVCFTIYFVLFLYWTDYSFFQKKIIYLFSVILILVLCDFTLYPLSILRPVQLMNKDLGPIQLLINLSYYSFSVLFLRHWFKKIDIAIISLFNNIFLGIFLCISLLSIVWSETPVYALKYSLMMMQITLLAAQIATEYSWSEIISLLRWSTSIISALSCFYALTQPSIGVMFKGWKGVMSHPNRLGVVLALNITLWLFHAMHHKNQRAIAVGIIGLSLYVRENTNSQTSLIVIILLMMLLGALKVLRTLPYKQAFVGVLSFMLVGTCLAFIILENWNNLLVSLDKDPTLTGRTIVWPQIIERGMDRPFFGHGNHSFWQDWRGEDNPAYGIVSDNGWVPPHAHNGFLELFLDFGFVGLLLFLFSFLVTISMTVQYMISSPVPEALLPPLILTWIIIPNITVSSLFTPSLMWFIYVVINVRVSRDLGNQN